MALRAFQDATLPFSGGGVRPPTASAAGDADGGAARWLVCRIMKGNIPIAGGVSKIDSDRAEPCPEFFSKEVQGEAQGG
jgi:hypothetical protein